MRSFEAIKLDTRINIEQMSDDGGTAWIWRVTEKRPMFVIFSTGGGWDHVSASYANKCPSWDDMCYLKKLFFEPEECAIQYHPPMSQYVNCHPYCLHIWKKQDYDQPVPPTWMLAKRSEGK